MKLNDLLNYDKITLQCHDNPDPDSVAAALALYEYFESQHKNTRMIYSGKNSIQKANLKLMVEELNIPIEYYPEYDYRIQGLLITVDCQYGAGNVTRIPADAVAVIDHHQAEMPDMKNAEIRPSLGSCSTLVWQMLQEVGFPVNENKRIGTALYYGLMTDTGTFSEIFHPADRDMRDELLCDKTLVSLFCNSNLSLKELEIAGIALLRYIYNDEFNYAIIHSQPCDPNILGLISDLALQVDEIKCCVVYNELQDGYKLSVRSCVKEIRANELAVYLTEGLGGGGGHIDKAGGFISKSKYEAKNPALHTETFFGMRLSEYFESTQIIYAKDYVLDTSDMRPYKKKKIVLGFADPSEFLPDDTAVTIRTLEGDIDQKINGEFYIMIGLKGEVYPIKKTKFATSYEVLETPYVFEAEYQPTIRSKIDGNAWNLVKYAKSCLSTGVSFILAKELKNTVKIFTVWDDEKYMLGKPSDFIACRSDDPHDIYVVERDIFFKTYESIEKER